MKRRHRERGAVLIVVMMVMLGLLGLGVAALWLTSGNLQVGANMNQRTQALYVAEAGVARARAFLNRRLPTPPDLRNDDGNPSALQASGQPRDDVPDGLDAGGQPNKAGAILVIDGVPLANVQYPPASFGRTTGTAADPTPQFMGTYTVWIRNDTAEIRRAVAVGPPSEITNDRNQSVVVRSLGLAQDGRTSVVLEVALGGTPGSPGVSGPVGGGGLEAAPGGKNSTAENNNTVSGIVVN